MASDSKSGSKNQRLFHWPGLIEHYRRFLPVTDSTPVVTLNEGNTPLIEAPAIAERLGLNIKVYFKFEGANPTGSFKDRGMTVAISKALGEGARAVICASTGNTAASAAAYAGRAGLKAFVLIPKGAVALGKLSQSVMHGARVLEVIGNFDICLKVVRDVAERDPVRIRLVNSVNPDRIAGQKTAAFEICDQLGDAPTHHFLPVGNAGNITAYWAGYQEYKSVGLSERVPKMMGYQAAESAPIVVGHPIDDPHTVATAIKIGNPASWKGATERARRVGRDHRHGHRFGNPRGLSAHRGWRGIRGAGVGCFGRGFAEIRRRRDAQAGLGRRMHAHGARPEGSGHSAEKFK